MIAVCCNYLVGTGSFGGKAGYIAGSGAQKAQWLPVTATHWRRWRYDKLSPAWCRLGRSSRPLGADAALQNQQAKKVSGFSALTVQFAQELVCQRTETSVYLQGHLS